MIQCTNTDEFDKIRSNSTLIFQLQKKSYLNFKNRDVSVK